MKAIILSAGQGKRLMPLTERSPKCTVMLKGKALLDWQIDGLLANGVDQIVVVTGFGAEHVERLVAVRGHDAHVKTIFNPHFKVADNLVSCWTARGEMTEDFVLLNGDTVFEPGVLRRLVDAPYRPITLAIDQKTHYDDDDMKVQLDGPRLLRVGKDLPLDRVDGESIGMMVFRDRGWLLFRKALEHAARRPRAEDRWYLSVLDELARTGSVWTQSISGLSWSEIDYPLDLVRASSMVGAWNRPKTEWPEQVALESAFECHADEVPAALDSAHRKQ